MYRTFVRQALAVAMIAGATYACQAVKAQDDYSADCPGGNAHGIGLHGDGQYGYGHQHGHRPYGDYPLAYNRAAYDESFHEYAGGHGCRTCNGGNCQYRFYGQPDLFYNYYTWNNCGAIPAALYISPRPVPPHVGHTYITYQPLYPHEFMYTHHRTYHRYYNSGQGLNRTSVHYRYSPFGEWH
jgi:hypothetical protein